MSDIVLTLMGPWILLGNRLLVAVVVWKFTWQYTEMTHDDTNTHHKHKVIFDPCKIAM